MTIEDREAASELNLRAKARRRSVGVKHLCLPLTTLMLLVMGASLQPSRAKVSRGTKHTVTISFEGLFFFAFPKAHNTGQPSLRTEGQVGIISSRQNDHLLGVKLIRASSKEETIVLTHSVLQTLTQEVTIKKLPESANKGVTIQGALVSDGWGKPEPRNTLTPPECSEAKKCSFNWIIDFEGGELHGGHLTERRATLRPKIHIRTGTFYTLKMAKDFYYKVKDGVFEDFGWVAEKIAVEIELEANETLYLELDKSYPLDDDLRAIELKNIRPEPGDDSMVALRSSKAHVQAMSAMGKVNDDLQIYYDDLFDFPNPRERFMLVPRKRTGGAISLPFICYTAGGSVW